jgi:hypothetical protein
MVEQANTDPFAKSSSLPQTLGADLSNLYESVYKKTDDEAQKAKETYAKEAGDIGIQKAEIKAKPAQQFAAQYANISKKYEPELMAKAPEFKVDQNTASGIASMAALLPIAGALFGGKGQMSGIGALQAMDGVLKGYQAGNKERIEFEKTKFEKELQNFKMHQDKIQKAFDRAIEGAKVNLTAATAGLERDLAALDQKNLLAIVQKDGAVKGQDRYHSIIDPIYKELAKNLPSVMSIGGVTQGAGPQATLARMLDPQTAAKTDPKAAKEIVDKVTSVKNTMDLVKKAQDPDIKFGEVGTTFENISSKIRRNISGLKDNASEADVLKAINDAAKDAKLNPNDKNIVFYKEAIFTALELERQARGGSILPVAVMKTLTPLLDPRTTTRQQYIEILTRRANDVARASGLTPDQFTKAVGNVPTFNLGGGAAASAAAPDAPAPSAKPTLDEFLAKAKTANPTASDQELIDYYNGKYGAK